MLGLGPLAVKVDEAGRVTFSVVSAVSIALRAALPALYRFWPTTNDRL
jgi:hypothetical protein